MSDETRYTVTMKEAENGRLDMPAQSCHGYMFQRGARIKLLPQTTASRWAEIDGEKIRIEG